MTKIVQNIYGKIIHELGPGNEIFQYFKIINFEVNIKQYGGKDDHTTGFIPGLRIQSFFQGKCKIDTIETNIEFYLNSKSLLDPMCTICPRSSYFTRWVINSWTHGMNI